MRAFHTVVFIFLTSIVHAQDISGKWYGKLTQGPGAYSEQYDIELDITQRSQLSGQSYAYLDEKLDVRIKFLGYIMGNEVELQEFEDMIVNEKVPYPWRVCIKKYNLTYRIEGNHEYLEGEWSGKGKESEDPDECIPGNVILAKSKSELQAFLETGKFDNLVPGITSVTPLPVITPEFNNTEVKKVDEIVVSDPQLQIRLLDYRQIDNDTVSVYVNRKLVAKNIRISRQPFEVSFNIDPRAELNEILLFAENLGKIPPNTSLMEIIDGEKTHRIRIESDKQKSAAIYLRYQPKPKPASNDR